MNVLSLFSGIGGIELGLERAGMTVVGQVESNPFCASVLRRHWPNVPRHDDVRTAIEWWDDGPVDLVCGGFPCQDLSSANVVSRTGLSGSKSGLWKAFRNVIEHVKPTWAIIENSPNWQAWTPVVRRDLRHIGMSSVALELSAGTFGAPHRRPRCVVVANADREGQPLLAIHAKVAGLQAVPRRSDQPSVPRVVGVVDGIPYRVDRLRALGNAADPRVFEFLGRAILEVAR